MCDHELPAVQPIMASEFLDEGAHRLNERRSLVFGQRIELGERFFEAVRYGNVPTVEFTRQLILMVALNAQGRAGIHHFHDRAKNAHDVRTTINKVANEDGTATIGMPPRDLPVEGFAFISELAQERSQLRTAAVNIANNVEGP
jgi:hypothetical protein